MGPPLRGKGCKQRNSSPQAKQPRRILLQHQRSHSILDIQRTKIRQPPIRRNQRIIRPKQHLLPQHPIDSPNKLRRKILRRPPRQIYPHVSLVRGHRDRRILPRHRRMRQDHLQRRKISRHVVNEHRIGIPQPNPPPTRQPSPDPSLPGVKQNRHPSPGSNLVQRIIRHLIRHKPLQRRMQLNPPRTSGKQLAQQTDRPRIQRIHRTKRYQHIRMLTRPSNNIHTGQSRMPGRGMRVHSEHNSRQPPLPIISRHRRQRRRPVRTSLEIGGRRIDQLPIQRQIPMPIRLNVHMRIDRPHRVNINSHDNARR